MAATHWLRLLTFSSRDSFENTEINAILDSADLASRQTTSNLYSKIS